MKGKDVDVDRLALTACEKTIDEEVLMRQLKIQLPLEFCLNLLPYLKGETVTSKNKNENFSDKQLTFLYEVCGLLDYEPFKDKTFAYNDYQQEDYLRNALIKFTKKLKTNRNQNRYSFSVKGF
ncbi:MAG: hypothetical protein JWR05_3385 [Mucilaginibacter sp.]|nr:hypothetical protein [Mucilaginibacter sp.]